jgi:hypothetical protein
MKAMAVRFAFFVLGTVAAIAAVVFGSLRWREHRLMEQSKPIQVSLESYRVTHGYYPAALSRIGVVEKEDGPIYYSRESDSSYLLWFGTSLGESMRFHSSDRTWR